MSKIFRPWDIDQRWLSPPSVHELVPAGHLYHFVRQTGREKFGQSGVFATCDEERGISLPELLPPIFILLVVVSSI